MGKLDFISKSESLGNHGLITGISNDMYNIVDGTTKYVNEIVTPVKIATGNLFATLANPGNIFKGSTYSNVLKFIPRTLLHELALTLRLPFATIDKGIEYYISNNMERIHKTLKGTTYGTFAKLLEGANPGKFRGALGKGVEGIGDGISSLVKGIPWLIQKPFSYVNNKLTPITEKTGAKLEETKIYDSPIFKANILSGSESYSNNNITERPKNLEKVKEPEKKAA